MKIRRSRYEHVLQWKEPGNHWAGTYSLVGLCEASEPSVPVTKPSDPAPVPFLLPLPEVSTQGTGRSHYKEPCSKPWGSVGLDKLGDCSRLKVHENRGRQSSLRTRAFTSSSAPCVEQPHSTEKSLCKTMCLWERTEVKGNTHLGSRNENWHQTILKPLLFTFCLIYN